MGLAIQRNYTDCCVVTSFHILYTKAPHLYLFLGEHLVKGGDQRLGQSEREDELGASSQKLGHKTLEEGAGTLGGNHVLDDLQTGLGVVEVSVLDSGLDDIERSRDNQRGRGTKERGNNVLAPGGLGVVLESQNVLLGKGVTSKQSKGSGGVSGSGPAPASVQTHTLLLDDLEEASALESLGVSLSLDLEDIEGQENNLSNTDQGTGGGRQKSLSGLLAEGLLVGGAPGLGQVLVDEGLATVLVNSLQNLVAGGVSQTGEQGSESLADGGVGVVSKNDLVQVRRRSDLTMVGHESLGDGVDGVEDGELGNTGGGWVRQCHGMGG